MGALRKTALTSGNIPIEADTKNMEPTLKRVSKDGEWVWEVTYNGIARYHSQDWQARWIYEQALRIYSEQAN